MSGLIFGQADHTTRRICFQEKIKDRYPTLIYELKNEYGKHQIFSLNDVKLRYCMNIDDETKEPRGAKRRHRLHYFRFIGKKGEQRVSAKWLLEGRHNIVIYSKQAAIKHAVISYYKTRDKFCEASNMTIGKYCFFVSMLKDEMMYISKEFKPHFQIFSKYLKLSTYSLGYQFISSRQYFKMIHANLLEEDQIRLFPELHKDDYSSSGTMKSLSGANSKASTLERSA